LDVQTVPKTDQRWAGRTEHRRTFHLGEKLVVWTELRKEKQSVHSLVLQMVPKKGYWAAQLGGMMGRQMVLEMGRSAEEMGSQKVRRMAHQTATLGHQMAAQKDTQMVPRWDKWEERTDYVKGNKTEHTRATLVRMWAHQTGHQRAAQMVCLMVASTASQMVWNLAGQMVDLKALTMGDYSGR
jgi:hypothetical protein